MKTNIDLDFLVNKLNTICCKNEKFSYTNTEDNGKPDIFVLLRTSDKKTHVIKRGKLQPVVEFLLEIIKAYSKG
jgi:hypothetical protein